MNDRHHDRYNGMEELLSTNLAEVGTDCISRQAAINAFNTNIDELVVSGKENADAVERYLNRVIDEIKQLPPIQPVITHEQAIDYLQSTGWMREHDLQMMLDGVHRLTAQPEIIRCKDCKFGEQDEVGRWFCRSLGCQIGNEDGSGFCADAERRTKDEDTL